MYMEEASPILAAVSVSRVFIWHKKTRSYWAGKILFVVGARIPRAIGELHTQTVPKPERNRATRRQNRAKTVQPSLPLVTLQVTLGPAHGLANRGELAAKTLPKLWQNVLFTPSHNLHRVKSRVYCTTVVLQLYGRSLCRR